ncbi:MAG: hypothetical protein K6G57_05645 [Lachnospiraceae bacterium]|nr:hypothetical protein [Lachnospiraceae bacterium]
MNSKQEKIAKIKKSCKVGKIISRIFNIICIIACVASLVGAVLTGIGKVQIDRNGITNLITGENGPITSEEIAELNKLTDGALAEDLDASVGDLIVFTKPFPDFFSKVIVLCLLTAFIAACTAVLFHLFGQVFGVIITEDSPFTEAVLKKLRINFIILSALILLCIGLFPALIAAFLFWCIYNILDYGCVLQTESDETL